MKGRRNRQHLPQSPKAQKAKVERHYNPSCECRNCRRLRRREEGEMDRRTSESLDHWLTTDPRDTEPDLDEDILPDEKECTIAAPHRADECDGVHFGAWDT